jgi:hypothetical protein
MTASTIRTSQPPLSMYIFQPILESAMGITNTNKILPSGQPCAINSGIEGHLRRDVEEELEHAHAARADRVVQHLGRVQVEDRRPAEAVRSLEEEYRRDRGVDACAVVRRPVRLRPSALRKS